MITLVGFWNHFNHTHLTFPKYQELYRPWLRFEYYRESTMYDPKSTVFVVNHYQYHNLVNATITQLINRGYCVIIENLPEAQPSVQLFRPNVRHFVTGHNIHNDPNIVEVPLYFWYYEQQITRYKIGRRPNFQKKFLLMMNLIRDFRDTIFERFQPIQSEGLCSYVERGIHLPEAPRHADRWDRNINPDWFDSTHFSVAVETQMNITPGAVFVTEKTFKPMALEHPYISLACSGTLDLVSDAGFATFDNLFDESYDSVDNVDQRIDLVYQQVCDYIHTGYDAETQKRIKHNMNHFYDQSAVTQSFKASIVDPILEFVNG